MVKCRCNTAGRDGHIGSTVNTILVQYQNRSRCRGPNLALTSATIADAREAWEGTEDAKALMKRFYALQEERVETYALFDEGFQAYLAGAPHYNFPMYRQLVHEITQTFVKISDEVASIADRLHTQHDLLQVTKCIRVIQGDEKEKLEKTAQLQIAKQNMIDHPDDGKHKDECRDLEESLKEIVERINEQLEDLKFESEDIMVS